MFASAKGTRYGLWHLRITMAALLLVQPHAKPRRPLMVQDGTRPLLRRQWRTQTS